MSKELVVKGSLITEVKSDIDLLFKYINLYSAIGLPEHNWLSAREREFFAWCVILHSQGYDLVSKEAVVILEDKLNFNKENRGIYIYRDKVKKKGWLVQTSQGLVVTPDFSFKKGIPTSFKINVEING